MLLDFGLAKGYLAEMTHVAGESSIVGYTPGYSPPEQVDGTGTDGRSDLYALGATIHQLLTKSPPVDERSRWRAVGRGRPDPLKPVHTLNPLVPPEVSEVLVQALALERDERPPTATAMRAALRAAYRGAGTALASAVPAPPPAHENDATAMDAAPPVSRDDPVAILKPTRNRSHTMKPSRRRRRLRRAISTRRRAPLAGSERRTGRHSIRRRSRRLANPPPISNPTRTQQRPTRVRRANLTLRRRRKPRKSLIRLCRIRRSQHLGTPKPS